MSKYGKNIDKILKSEIFLNLMNCDKIKIIELNAAIALLIKYNIGFEVIFTPATTKNFAIIELRIYLTPRTILELIFQLDGCQ